MDYYPPVGKESHLPKLSFYSSESLWAAAGQCLFDQVNLNAHFHSYYFSRKRNRMYFALLSVFGVIMSLWA
jgi:hypothetical protein